MIDVIINLDAFGLGERIKPLCRIVIFNDATGDSTTGNYKVLVSHQAGYKGHEIPSAHSLCRAPETAWKRGEVKNFKRELGAAHLLGRALQAVGLTAK